MRDDLERIRMHSQRLTYVADSYARLCNIAMKEGSDHEFVALVEAIGHHSCNSLAALGLTLEMYFDLAKKNEFERRVD